MSRGTQGLPHAVECLGFADAVAGFAEEGEGLPQITQHAERLALLDDREAQHYQQIAERLREIATQLSDMSTRVHTATGTITDQAAVLASLDGLDGTSRRHRRPARRSPPGELGPGQQLVYPRSVNLGDLEPNGNAG